MEGPSTKYVINLLPSVPIMKNKSQMRNCPRLQENEQVCRLSAACHPAPEKATRRKTET